MQALFLGQQSALGGAGKDPNNDPRLGTDFIKAISQPWVQILSFETKLQLESVDFCSGFFNLISNTRLKW